MKPANGPEQSTEESGARQDLQAALSAAAIAGGITRGDRMLLSRAITLQESARERDRRLAQDVLRSLPGKPGIRIGVTGAPGVGKSMFIDALGSYLTGRRHRVAVLAIDPTSSRTGGSILGDKTRMSRLAADPRAFVRPSPSRGTLGGIAASTHDTMRLCEAAGFSTVLVETIGVGQSEYGVRPLVDLLLLLVQPGAGDELQGIKRGIVEVADMFVVTKADGAALEMARRAQRHYRRAAALHKPALRPVELCSAVTDEGIETVWQRVEARLEQLRSKSTLERRRAAAAAESVRCALERELIASCLASAAAAESVAEAERAVLDGHMSSQEAARSIVAAFLSASKAR